MPLDTRALIGAGLLLLMPPTFSGMAAAQGNGASAMQVITFESSDASVDGFALYVRSAKGEEKRIDLGSVRADAQGTRTAPLPRLEPGTYTLSLAAYNKQGESAPVPASPSSVTIPGSTSNSRPSRSAADPRAESPSTSPAPPAPLPTSAETGKGADKKPAKKGNRLWRILVGED